jgi:pSer/pThr/pTyr-binding forkhead associated (FHA) protein
LPDGIRVVPLGTGRVTIGRGIENTLALSDDLKVSRLHASLDDYGAAWSIEDLGSRNGTYVNGSRLWAKQGLRPGDEIRVGDTVIRYESDLAPEYEASATLLDESLPPLTRRERGVEQER